MNFESFNLDTKINAGVKTLGFTVPTPIQQQAIPAILEGNDVMGLAQTGTGKTAAFALPILQRLLSGPRKRVRSLIIAPTRELTEQTHNAVKRLGCKTGLRGMSIYGGVSIRPQISTLQQGVDIVSACPGRLLDHINRGTIDVSNVEVLVLDEADQMFDMGFLPDIRKIIKRLPAERQTLLFSATMPNDIRRLANDVLQNPVKVQIGHTAPVETVAHTFYSVTTRKKSELLHTILNTTATGSVLVFTRTKFRSKRVTQQLEKSGFNATALHGNLSQNKRQQALDGFRKGRYKIMVATDVAARGIDVRAVSHVINYDMPDTVDAYTHRIGRTGRACETGDAFTFVTGEDNDQLRSIQQVLGTNLKHSRLEGFEGPEPERKKPPAKRRTGGHRATAGKTFKPKRRTRPRSGRRAGHDRPRRAAAY
jgi:ATP-dependent RNA helicase RhlE